MDEEDVWSITFTPKQWKALSIERREKLINYIIDTNGKINMVQRIDGVVCLIWIGSTVPEEMVEEVNSCPIG